mmetsp:Transcript_12000/g.22499  ORF Transcript_12000/g.22499 Transcript_12000/m.22499 type:complete len:202 (+) Transcript_12000:2806-3411(+)
MANKLVIANCDVHGVLTCHIGCVLNHIRAIPVINNINHNGGRALKGARELISTAEPFVLVVIVCLNTEVGFCSCNSFCESGTKHLGELRVCRALYPLVIHPLPPVFRSILKDTHTVTLPFVILPFTLIPVSILILTRPFPLSLVILPGALIQVSAAVQALATPVTHVASPISVVLRSILVMAGATSFPLVGIEMSNVLLFA